MDLLYKILGVRNFSTPQEIKKDLIKKHQVSNSTDEPEIFSNFSSILFFKSKKQQSWLICSNQNLYCILDDITKESFEVKWSIPKNKLISPEGEFILTINIDTQYTEFSGRIDFGDFHKGWLYSKYLFQSPENLKEDIGYLVKDNISI